MDSTPTQRLLPFLAHSTSDLVTYPLMYMSVIMQGTQPYRTLSRETEAIESRVYEQRGGKRGGGWKIALPCVRSYRDILDPYFTNGFRAQYKGFLILAALRLNRSTLTPINADQSKDWWSYCRFYALLFVSCLALKPLKTAYTRFAMQSPEAPVYLSLRHFFSTVPLREMYQGLSYTLATQTLISLNQANFLSFGMMLSMGYPLLLAETRMEVMSTQKGMQPYRYTSKSILGKIVAEEGIFGLYRGLFAFGLYVRPRQTFFHSIMAVAFLTTVSKSIITDTSLSETTS